jgi:hypothetical protein
MSIAFRKGDLDMATARSLDGALAFTPRSPGVRRFLKGLTLYWSAISEGAAAAHEYAALTRRGVAHEQAVEQVFVDHFSRH